MSEEMFNPETGEKMDAVNVEASASQVQSEQTGSTMNDVPNAGDMKGTEAPKKINPAIIVAAVLAALVVAAGIAFAVVMLLAKKPADQIIQAFETANKQSQLAKALDVSDLVADGQSTFQVTASGSMGAQTAKFTCNGVSNNKDKNVRMSGNVAVEKINSDYDYYFSPEKIMMKVNALSDKFFLYDVTGEKNGYLATLAGKEKLSALDQYIKDVSAVKVDAKAEQKKCKDAVLKEVKNRDYKKAEAKELEIAGKKVMCKGYTTIVTTDEMKKWVGAAQKEYETIYGNNFAAQEKLMTAFGAANTGVEYKEMFDEINKALDESGNVTVTVYLYKKQLAAVLVEDLDKEKGGTISLLCKGGDYALQNVALSFEDKEDSKNNFSIEKTGSVNGDVEKAEISFNGDAFKEIASVKIGSEYNTKTGEWKLSGANGPFSVNGTVDVKRTDNELSLKLQPITVSDVSGEMSFDLKKGGKVEQPDTKEAIDVFNLNEEEVSKLVMELQQNMYKLMQN